MSANNLVEGYFAEVEFEDSVIDESDSNQSESEGNSELEEREYLWPFHEIGIKTRYVVNCKPGEERKIYSRVGMCFDEDITNDLTINQDIPLTLINFNFIPIYCFGLKCYRTNIIVNVKNNTSEEVNLKVND